MNTIPVEQIHRRLAAENPWWGEGGSLPAAFRAMTPRPYLDLFFPLVGESKVRRAVVLLGPRRVGKTVLLHHAIGRLLAQGVAPQRICFVAIDHPLYNGLSVDELLAGFAAVTGTDPAKDPCFLFLDEIQYLRGWEAHVKALVDGGAPIRCVVSGSAAAALRLKSHESGAGRFTDFLLPPLTFYEYLKLVHPEMPVRFEMDSGGGPKVAELPDCQTLNRCFVDYLNYGGYPELALSPEVRADPGRFVKSDIIDKVLLRDLPSLYGIQDVQELNYLFTTLAYNTGSEVSLDELAKRSGVAKPTIKRYIEYLEAAFLVRVVHRVDRSARRFQRANFFKVYLTNPSMRAALFGSVDSDDPAMGGLVETGIFAQLFHAPEPAYYYARWDSGEVDLVSLGSGQKATWAVEIKWTDRPYGRPTEELRSLVSFCHAQNLTKAFVTTRSISDLREMESISVYFFPASMFCCLAGFVAVADRFARQGVNPWSSLLALVPGPRAGIAK